MYYRTMEGTISVTSLPMNCCKSLTFKKDWTIVDGEDCRERVGLATLIETQPEQAITHVIIKPIDVAE